MKLSKYVYKIEKFSLNENYIALYNSITMDVAYIKKDIYKQIISNHIDNLSKSIQEKLTKNNIIIEDDCNEEEILRNERKKVLKMSPTTLRLQLTDRCNLNCKYCQIEKNYQCNNELNMSKETAIRSLKIFKKFVSKDKKKTIIITGGEPLLNLDVMITIFKECKKIFDNYRIIVFTNGTNITESIAKIFKEYNALILVSIDGTKNQHDYMRQDFNNKGSFEKAVKGYKICKDVGCKVGISGVVGNHNIEDLKSTLKQYIELEPASIGMNFPHYLLDSDNSKLISMEQYVQEIIKIYKICRRKGIYLENINRIIEPFIKKEIRGKECGALGRGITVLSNGMVGPCKTLLVADVIGKNIDEIEKLKKLEYNDEFKKWNKRSTFTIPRCTNCVGIGICGTGCAYDSYVLNKNINDVDRRACVFTFEILNFLINDLYKKIKNKKRDILIPNVTERQKIMGKIVLNQKIIKSAGHDNLEK